MHEQRSHGMGGLANGSRVTIPPRSRRGPPDSMLLLIAPAEAPFRHAPAPNHKFLHTSPIPGWIGSQQCDCRRLVTRAARSAGPQGLRLGRVVEAGVRYVPSRSVSQTTDWYFESGLQGALAYLGWSGACSEGGELERHARWR